MSRKNILRIAAACAAVAAVIALVVLFSRNRKAPNSGRGTGGKTVEELLGLGEESAPVYYKGKEYRLNPDLESYLVMGVDKTGEAGSTVEFSKGGQADVLLVVVLDRTRERVTVLQLNRDTMTDIEVLSLTGEVMNTFEGQLALSHSYGDGAEGSCQSTVRTVSNLLYGVELDGYAALQMDAIPVLNDLVGGVTVTIEDDFSQADPTLAMGETVTLYGQHATNYVRSRRNVGDGSNVSRMRRHRTYFSAFADKLEEQISADPAMAAKLYQAAKPYMVTDMGSGTVTSLFEEAQGYENAGVVVLEGEVKQGEEFMEFYPDEENVRETVLDLFYLET